MQSHIPHMHAPSEASPNTLHAGHASGYSSLRSSPDQLPYSRSSYAALPAGSHMLDASAPYAPAPSPGVETLKRGMLPPGADGPSATALTTFKRSGAPRMGLSSGDVVALRVEVSCIRMGLRPEGFTTSEIPRDSSDPFRLLSSSMHPCRPTLLLHRTTIDPPHPHSPTPLHAPPQGRPYVVSHTSVPDQDGNKVMQYVLDLQAVQPSAVQPSAPPSEQRPPDLKDAAREEQDKEEAQEGRQFQEEHLPGSSFLEVVRQVSEVPRCVCVCEGRERD
jgi:hypothetical protein